MCAQDMSTSMMMSQMPAAAEKTESRDLIGLVLEAVRHGLAFRPPVCAAFLEAMRSLVCDHV